MPSFKSCSPGQQKVMQNNQSTTSVNTMPFSQNFEAQVNSNMSPETQASSSSSKGPVPVSSPDPMEAIDREFSEKAAMKDQSQPPPRFSTIFDTKMPASPTRAFESYPAQPIRKSGINIAKPVFWAVFAILLFETAVLFAYTVIGLMNNLPTHIVRTNSAGAVVAGCDCNTQPINISPNFFPPQGAQAPVVGTTTLSTATTTTATETASSSTSPLVLVDIMKSVSEMLASKSSVSEPSTSVTTVTPPGPTVRSTLLLTVDPSGSTIKPRPTVTSTKLVGTDGVEATPTLNTRDETTSPVSTASASSLIITPVTCLNANDDEFCVTVPSATATPSSSSTSCLNANGEDVCLMATPASETPSMPFTLETRT